MGIRRSIFWFFLGEKLETRPIGVRGGSDDRHRKWAIENEKAKSKQEAIALSAGNIFFFFGKRIGASHSDSAGQRKDSGQGGLLSGNPSATYPMAIGRQLRQLK